jgi:hypothetical protein
MERSSRLWLLFLLFGTAMALLATATLLFSGTPLNRVWSLNPRAYHALMPLGKTAGVGFALLPSALAIAAIGWRANYDSHLSRAEFESQRAKRTARH